MRRNLGTYQTINWRMPRGKMSKPEKFWDQSADNYDKTEERFEYIHSRSRDLAKEHLKDRDVVLDYGCGTGTTACEIAGHVKEIQGIDISARMIEIATGKAAKAKIANVDFAQGDIFDDQFFNSFRRVMNDWQELDRGGENGRYRRW